VISPSLTFRTEDHCVQRSAKRASARLSSEANHTGARPLTSVSEAPICCSMAGMTAVGVCLSVQSRSQSARSRHRRVAGIGPRIRPSAFRPLPLRERPPSRLPTQPPMGPRRPSRYAPDTEQYMPRLIPDAPRHAPPIDTRKGTGVQITCRWRLNDIAFIHRREHSGALCLPQRVLSLRVLSSTLPARRRP
jgi:hypothetical protein